MELIKKMFPLMLFVLLWQIVPAQNGVYLAYFDNTGENVYRDKDNKLIMNYRIEGPESQSEIDVISSYFTRFNLCESFSITPSGSEGVWNVTEKTRAGVKIRDHRKLFAMSGIFTVFVNGEPYPVETFRVKMLNN